MTPDDLKARLREAAILPILTVHELDATLRKVDALVTGGVQAIEIVLRTTQALDAVTAVRSRFPNLLVAAGTVLSPASLDTAVLAGAQCVISPGLSAPLIEHHRGHGVPMLPGVLSPTEVLTAADAGYKALKYYPAVASNGSLVLDDYANLFPDVTFVPTGKIGYETLSDFARLKNVICVGGSWMHSGAIEDIPEAVRRSLSMVRDARG